MWERPNWMQARLTIERHGPRMLDDDNCRGGTKHLTDALVHAGILFNDCPDVIGQPEIHQIVSRRKKTIVRICAINEHNMDANSTNTPPS